MELKQLRYFMYVAKYGSYTRAAEMIDVAQPILSRQVRKLEIELHQNLLIRHGRGVVLTDSGKLLLRHVIKIMEELDETYEDLSITDGKLSGHITLGLPPTVAKLISLPLVEEFALNLPLANLTIVEALTVNMQESLHLGRVDIGLFYNPSFSIQADMQLLVEEELYVIAKQGYFPSDYTHIDALQLAEIPLIMPTLPNTFRVLVQKKLADLGVKPKLAWEIDSLGTIIQMVGKGMGCAVLSKYSFNLIDKNLGLKALPISSPEIISRLYLAYSSQRKLLRLQKEVIKLVEKACGKVFIS